MRAAPYRGGQPRARKRKASIGKNRISAVIYLPTPLVGSRWCLVGKIIGPLLRGAKLMAGTTTAKAAILEITLGSRIGPFQTRSLVDEPARRLPPDNIVVVAYSVLGTLA